jgi:molybdate transport system permease protein
MDWSPLVISLRVSLTATVLSLLIGIPLAYLLGKKRFAGRSAAEGLVNLPLVLPPTVLGYFLLVLLGRRHLIGRIYEALFHQSLVFTWQGAAVAACITSLPLLITQARVAFAGVDRDIEDCARSCGASEWQVFWHITFPLARRGVVAGTTLSFARALGDFGATLMVAGNIPDATQTMPLAIYDAVQMGDTRVLLTFVVITSLLAIVFTLAASRLVPRA